MERPGDAKDLARLGELTAPNEERAEIDVHARKKAPEPSVPIHCFDRLAEHTLGLVRTTLRFGERRRGKTRDPDRLLIVLQERLLCTHETFARRDKVSESDVCKAEPRPHLGYELPLTPPLE